MLCKACLRVNSNKCQFRGILCYWFLQFFIPYFRWELLFKCDLLPFCDFTCLATANWRSVFTTVWFKSQLHQCTDKQIQITISFTILIDKVYRLSNLRIKHKSKSDWLMLWIRLLTILERYPSTQSLVPAILSNWNTSDTVLLQQSFQMCSQSHLNSHKKNAALVLFSSMTKANGFLPKCKF